MKLSPIHSTHIKEKVRDMGKYMRKAKVTGDLAVKELSQSTLGVCTRARTLALQRLQSSVPTDTAASPFVNPDYSYLQLRSRRLEKPPLLRKRGMHKSQKNSANKQGLVCGEEEKPQIEHSTEKACSVSGFSVELAEEEDACFERQSRGFEMWDAEIEASLGENNLDLEAMERSTRERTPCSLIRAADTITTPGSSTKPTSSSVSNQRARNSPLKIMPTESELDDFFNCAEEARKRLFIEKYNFDIVNDIPLPGRYEWVRVFP